MEIILAKTAGFCFGVKRAVETVYKPVSYTHLSRDRYDGCRSGCKDYVRGRGCCNNQRESGGVQRITVKPDGCCKKRV